MKLILSTSNIIGGDGATLRPTGRSDSELTTSLRSNFISAREAADSEGAQRVPFRSWTTQEADSLYIPSIDSSVSGLSEERSSYDITVKLFYLPNIPPSRRCAHTKEAVDLVLKELKVDKIDLLIVSFPNIVFDADDESEEEFSDASSGEPNAPEDMATMIQTWGTIEGLHEKGIVDKLGLAEFGTGRLTRILADTKIRPSVDQINVRDCCVVPKPLILFAKKEGIDLLTHSDCTNILPRGTLRELLGPGDNGVGVLASGTEEGQKGISDGLAGDIEPQWVIKYTAVVKNRGVVENKGYFAVAELKDA